MLLYYMLPEYLNFTFLRNSDNINEDIKGENIGT